jgi:hypothetical protein
MSMDPENETLDFEVKELCDHITYLCGSLVRIIPEDRIELIHTTAKRYVFQFYLFSDN